MRPSGFRRWRNWWQKRRYLGTTRPVSRLFGFDRGTPVDRYYIERFLAAHRESIRGEVLEIADSTYTRKFGASRVSRAMVLHAEAGPKIDFAGDLASGRGLSWGVADCFILTQTLMCIYDAAAAAANAVRILKPGGVLLCTVAGVTQISRYDMDRWGHYWSFTDLGLRRLFETAAPTACIEVSTYGNVRAACGLLYGLCAEEIGTRDMDRHDPDYPVTVAAAVTRTAA